MSDELKRLLDLASRQAMTPAEQEAQRRSFAYGNTHFENANITRETVAQAAEELAGRRGSQD